MNCPHCGEVCSCHPEPPLPVPVPGTDDPGKVPEYLSVRPDDAPSGPAPDLPDEEQDPEWRDELAARLNRYRARRKMRPPRYPSLQLPFSTRATSDHGNSREFEAPPAHFEPLMDHALALDRPAAPAPAPSIAENITPAPAERPPLSGTAVHSGAKIIQFPSFAWAPPPPPLDQLAEPVLERPRILEVPEVTPPPPALGGITIEPPQAPEPERRPGIDFPLQSASLGRRVLAGSLDVLIVVAASSLFAFTFWKVSAVIPPRPQLFSLGLALPGLFWAAYQYLLLVYAGRTPGSWAFGLELSRFDGTASNRSLRRWRVLASYLSAASLGMGYVWVFLDEDSLCWHDRITHTYLAPKSKR